MTPTEIVARYSGDGTALGSLGGAIHANVVTSQSISALSNVTGITIDRVVNLPSSVDFWTNDQTTYKRVGWTGADFLGQYVDITGDGTYSITAPSGDPADGFFVFTATYASISPGEVHDYLTTTDATENIFPNVTAAQAGAGDTQYRCIYLLNNSVTETISSLVLWIGQSYSGNETVSIAFDSAGVGGTATTIADGSDSGGALSGLTFVSPTTEASGISVSTIGPGVAVPLWIKRVVPAGVTEAVANDTFGLSIAAYV